MPIAQVLADFNADVAQCENLIVNAHRTDAAGASLLPSTDRQQITVAAFLNLFIAWEAFLEASIGELMIGEVTIGGRAPTRYVIPPNLVAARELIVGMMRFFDYANHQFVRKTVRMYFQNGYPYEPHLSAVLADLDDLRTMRNASAHISSTTQTALESLAIRIFGQPKPGITLYEMLTSIDPRSGGTGDTVFVTYRKKLVVTANLISQG